MSGRTGCACRCRPVSSAFVAGTRHRTRAPRRAYEASALFVGALASFVARAAAQLQRGSWRALCKSVAKGGRCAVSQQPTMGSSSGRLNAGSCSGSRSSWVMTSISGRPCGALSPSLDSRARAGGSDCGDVAVWAGMASAFNERDCAGLWRSRTVAVVAMTTEDRSRVGTRRCVRMGGFRAGRASDAARRPCGLLRWPRA